MNFKIIAVDMDGTLLMDNQQISVKTKRLIIDLGKKGLDFVFASGRPYHSLYPYAYDLNVSLPLITTNGALIRSIKSNKADYRSVIPFNLTKEVVDFGSNYNYSITVYYEDEIITFDEDTAKRQWKLEKIRPKVVKDLFFEKEPIKIIYYGEPERLAKIVGVVRSKFKDRLYITQSDKIYLEFMNIEVSKGNGLKQIIKTRNIPSNQVMAIGNNYNDLSMFEVAGFSVAMANSPQEVKLKADFVTKSNQEDGVAYALERLI